MEASGMFSLDWRHAIGLLSAVALGALIGLEREVRKHPAGLHTNALVALGAAAFVMAGVLMGDNTGPARVAGQVVTGVGFLCAGLIWHVGGTVREPKKISDVRPVYPAIAQAAKVEGMVILEAVINERGTVERVRVLRSVPLLDAAAVEAVRNWRYTPTLLNGTPVSVLMTITLHFTLHD